MTPQQHYAFAEIFELVTEEDCTLEEAVILTTERLIEVHLMDEGYACFFAEQAADLVAEELGLKALKAA